MQESSRFAVAVLTFLLLATRFGVAGEPEDSWRVWLEPRFMHAAASSPIAGAKQTDLAGGTLQSEDLAPFGQDEWKSLGVEWSAFFAKARENSATDLAALKPEYKRNSRKVIEYAVLRSEQPMVASAILAPKFLELFKDTLGPKVLVVVPNRFVAIVFPALVSNYRDYTPLVLREYHATSYPVSREVFEVSAEGMKAVGAFEEP